MDQAWHLSKGPKYALMPQMVQVRVPPKWWLSLLSCMVLNIRDHLASLSQVSHPA